MENVSQQVELKDWLHSLEKMKADIRDTLTLPKTVLQLALKGKKLPKPVLQDAVACIDEIIVILKKGLDKP